MLLSMRPLAAQRWATADGGWEEVGEKRWSFFPSLKWSVKQSGRCLSRTSDKREKKRKLPRGVA